MPENGLIYEIPTDRTNSEITEYCVVDFSFGYCLNLCEDKCDCVFPPIFITEDIE